ELSKSFYLSISLNVLGLFLGYLLAASLFNSKYYHTVIKNTIESSVSNYVILENKIRKAHMWLCFLGLLGVIIGFITLFQQVSLQYYLIYQAAVKTEISRSILAAYLSTCAFVAVPLGGILRWILGRSRVYIVLPMVICFFYSVSFWGRFPFMIALSMLGGTYILNKLLLLYRRGGNKIIISRLIRGSALVVLVVVVVFAFLSWTIEWRVSGYGEGYGVPSSQISSNAVTDVLENISPVFGSYRAVQITVSYLTASFPTLDYWVSRESEYGLGQASFPYIFRLLHKVGLIGEPKIVGDRVLGDGLQLPSFVGYAYIDFGFFGIVAYSFLLSFVSSVLYYNYFIKPSIIRCLYLSFIYATVLVSPQVFTLVVTSSALIVAYSFILNKFYFNNM
ncbi:MAG: hypothetical protein ACYS3N_10925, partial [Planctomycetota bacterium]